MRKTLISLIVILLVIALLIIPTNVRAEYKVVKTNKGPISLEIDLTNGKTYPIKLTKTEHKVGEGPDDIYIEYSTTDQFGKCLKFAGLLGESMQASGQTAGSYTFTYEWKDGKLEMQLDSTQFPSGKVDSNTVLKVTEVDETNYVVSAVKTSDEKVTIEDTNPIEEYADSEQSGEDYIDYFNVYSPVSIKISYGTVKENNQEENNQEESKKEEDKDEFVIASDDNNVVDVLAEIRKMLDDLLAGTNPIGIDEDTARGVAKARSEGKQIKVDLSAKEVAKEEVAEDVEKAEQKLAVNEKIAGIFDVSINLKVDNQQLGKVTKLNKKLAFKLPIPKELRTVPAGYERIFSMLKIHDGVTKRIDAKSDGENVSGESDEYSTYVLTYTDKKITSNPETGDMIALSVAMFVASTTGAVLVLKKIR